MIEVKEKLTEFFSKRSNIVFSFLLLALVLYESRGLGDFDIFLSASRDLFSGGNIYKTNYQEWYHYFYDILFAVLIYPLSFLPLFLAKFIWLILNLFFSYRIWKIAQFFRPFEKLSHSQNRITTIITFVFIFSLWHRNIHLSQMTIFILYLCMEGIYKFQNERFIFGALLIGLGVSIKILPIVLIPYFIYRGNFKAAIYIVIATVLILFVPILFLDKDYFFLLVNERWNLINPLNQEHILDVSERSFHSLTTLLSTLFVKGAGNGFTLDLRRNIADVSLDTLKWIITIVRLVFIAGVLFFIKAYPFKKIKDKLQIFYELSYVFLVIPLIFPHQQHYSFFFVFPAITYLVFYFVSKYYKNEEVSRSKMILYLTFAFIIYFLLNSDFILGQFRHLYHHYKTLTYGVIMLIPLLYIAKPEKLRK